MLKSFLGSNKDNAISNNSLNTTPKGQAKPLEAANLQVCLKPFNFIDFFIEPVYGMRKQVSSSCSRVFG